jgi:hypothetical protein
MAKLSETARAYYGRLFVEELELSLGEDVISDNMNRTVDRRIESAARYAGLQIGTKLRLEFLTDLRRIHGA